SVLSAIFLAISKDSEKHGELYKSMAKLLKEAQPFISEEDFKIIKNTIDDHIKLERAMLEKARALLSELNDSRMKLILAAIVEDEGKHHKLLLDIREKIAKIETLTENMLWDMIWKDSPWHGSPGG
ncbi:MAG: hypothetical protein N3D72_01020, partial [Candidatus Methanomethyliaceae archaeon]|nr:hypothetical protein [Candidatus Methanomethyliaceae archaeon]